MQRLALIIFALLFSAPAFTQSIAGVWKGRLSQEPGGCFPQYFLELNITQDNQLLTGVSYDYYDTTIFVKFNFTGNYQSDKKRLTLYDKQILTYRIPAHCVPCIKTYTLTFRQEGGEDFLVGDWTGFDAEDSTKCPPGKIVLKRVPESAFKHDSLKVIDPVTLLPVKTVADSAQVFRNRANELVQTIKVDTSVIKIKFYDNAEIDDDTISVLFNKQIVLSKKRLTGQALELDLKIPSKNIIYELVMIAENLGKIPPNTALMVVYVREKRYELRVASTDKKNAMVRFVYE
jgi:hypothetical protein